jgi:hypothetical protein
MNRKKSHSIGSRKLRGTFFPALAVLLAAAALLTLGAGRASAQGTYSLNFDFSVAPGSAGSVNNTTGNRGVAYNVVSNQFYVGNSSSSAIDAFDGTAGTYIGSFSLAGLLAGTMTFKVDQLGVTSDGIIYDGGLQTASSPANQFKIYRWMSWNDPAPLTIYAADPTYGLSLVNKRIGDTMAVTGSGTNTLIICGFGTSTNYSLFYTADGTNFTNTIIGVAGLPSSSGNNCYGIAFYNSTSFLVKPNGGTIYQVQFPNVASLAGVQITNGTIVASTTLNGSNMVIDYNTAAKLLTTHEGGFASRSVTVSLWSLPSFGSGLTQLASTNDVVNTTEGGNATSAIAFGGPTKTNFVYVLETGNGIQASSINFTNTAVAPTITTQPGGGTIYTNDPSFIFSVTASGSTPFSYQWQYNTVSNTATATSIPNATNATLTLNNPVVTNSGWYNVLISNAGGGPTSSVPAQLTVLQPLLSPVVTNVWTLAPGSRPYLGTADYASRGLAYDTNTGTVLVSDHVTTNIYVLNAPNGNDLYTLSPPGITEGTFPLNLVGVGDDGIVYFGNLAVTSNPGETFNLYTYSSVSSNAVGGEAYSGDPGNGSGDRWGDTMAVRGAGVNTQVLLGSYLAGTSVALLTTQNGTTFSALDIPVPGVSAGFASQGLCFGAGNTFWCKGVGFTEPLMQISFDPTGANAAAIMQTYSNGMPADMTGLGVDVSNNILAGDVFNNTPYDLELYQLTGTTNNPTLFHQAFFPQVNQNAQENAMTAIKFPRAYSLNANNGIIALTYNVPSASVPPYSVTAAHVGASVVLSWPSVSGHNYKVLSSATLTPARSTWTTVTSLAGTGSTLSFTNSAPSGTLFYAIQAQ